MIKGKKTLSPVIASVLLVMTVIALALIVFLWARGFIKESITKNGMPSSQACDEIDLEVNLIGEELQVINRGNIPVYRLEVRKKTNGRIETESIEGVSAGDSAIQNLEGTFDEVEVVPAILGEAGTSKKIDVCENNVFKAG